MATSPLVVSPTTSPKTQFSNSQTLADLASKSGVSQQEALTEQQRVPGLNPDAIIGNILSSRKSPTVVSTAKPAIEDLTKKNADVVNQQALIDAQNANVNAASLAEKPKEEPASRTSPSSLSDQFSNVNKQFSEELDRLNSKSDQDLADYQGKVNQMLNGSFPLSPDQQAQINNLTAQFQSLIEDQKKANTNYTNAITKVGINAGRNMYAPEVELGNIKETVDQGLRKVSDLNQKMTSAITEARMAFEKQDFDLFNQSYETLQKAQEQRRQDIKDVFEDSQKQIIAMQQDLRDQQDFEFKVQEAMNKPIADANAADADVVRKWRQDHPDAGIDYATDTFMSAQEKVANSASFKQAQATKFGPDVENYNFYANQEKAAGRTPVSFNDYQTMDQNRKNAISIAANGGMTESQKSDFQSVTNNYQKDPIITNANSAVNINTVADQVIADPGNAANQLAGLYSFIKSLDPTSAVKEGELALASEIQSTLGKYKKNLDKLAEGKIISDDAAIDIANASKKLAQMSFEAGLRTEERYKSQSEGLGINTQFDEYLNRFERPYANDINIKIKKAATDTGYSQSDIDAAKAAGKSPEDILQFMESKKKSSSVSSSKPISQLNPSEIDSVIKAMANREGYKPGSANRPTKNNNPLNIKVGGATQHWIDQGLATVESKPAADGGHFLVFKDPETGFKAAKELLTGGVYKNLPIDDALRKWSGNGYGAEIVKFA